MTQISIKIVGTEHPNPDGTAKADNIGHCVPGEALVLKHTPSPQNAGGVSVYRQNGARLGWVPRKYAQEIAHLLDNNRDVQAQFVNRFRKHADAPLSAEVLITRPDTAPEAAGKKCGNCGAPVTKEAQKCTACGRGICTACGSSLGFGAARCGQCGQPVTRVKTRTLVYAGTPLVVLLVLIIFFLVTC